MVTKGWQNKIKAKTHWDWLLCAATLLLEHRRPSSDTILASAAVGTGLETFILIGSSNNKTAASTTLTAPHFKIPRTFIWRYNLSSDHPVLIPFLSARLNFEFLFGFIPPPPSPHDDNDGAATGRPFMLPIRTHGVHQSPAVSVLPQDHLRFTIYGNDTPKLLVAFWVARAISLPDPRPLFISETSGSISVSSGANVRRQNKLSCSALFPVGQYI